MPDIVELELPALLSLLFMLPLLVLPLLVLPLLPFMLPLVCGVVVEGDMPDGLLPSLAVGGALGELPVAGPVDEEPLLPEDWAMATPPAIRARQVAAAVLQWMNDLLMTLLH